MPDWARTIARHVLYETADAIRIERLKEHEDDELAGIAAKIEREEVYHRLHAEMWLDRLRNEQRYRDAADELWPYALGVLEPELRPVLAERVTAGGRGGRALGAGCGVRRVWNEMTMVRRSAPVPSGESSGDRRACLGGRSPRSPIRRSPSSRSSTSGS